MNTNISYTGMEKHRSHKTHYLIIITHVMKSWILQLHQLLIHEKKLENFFICFCVGICRKNCEKIQLDERAQRRVSSKEINDF